MVAREHGQQRGYRGEVWTPLASLACQKTAHRLKYTHMAEIRPFRGLRFNPQIIGDLGPVLCPPYDVLSPEDQQACHQRSPYNAVRLEQGEGVGEDKYLRAAATFRRWLAEGILRPDEAPAFYLHHHYFSHGGQTLRRRGLIARVRLEDAGKRTILPHEGTLSRAKDDRLRLLRACQANISPILTLYEDPRGKMGRLLAACEARSPLFSATEVNGDRHTLWAIGDQETVAHLASSLATLPLYIADGHHRYQTALAYRREMQGKQPQTGGEMPYDYGLMTLVATADPGLVILPVHRLVRGLATSALRGLKEKLAALFEMEALEGEPEALLATLRERGQRAIAIGLLGLGKEGLLLTRQEGMPASLMPPGSSPAYRQTDVSVLNHAVLEGMLGVRQGEDGLTYTSQAEDAAGRVRRGEYQLAFLLNPIRIDRLKAVADAGEILPGKSTYFYPKLPTGLVIYSLG